MRTNQDIRQAANTNGVYLWQIGERLKLSDANFSRKLRHELPPEEKQKIFAIIEALAKEREAS